MVEFEAGTVVVRLETIAAGFAQGVRKAEQQTEDLRQALERVSSSFSRVAVASAGAFAAIAGAIGLATREGTKFDDSLTNVSAITRATSEELKELEGIARSAGQTTVFSANEAADAMFNLASQGVKGAQAFDDLLNPILTAAAALRRDIQPTAALALSTIKSFGLENRDAARVVNIFSAANEASTLNLERLTEGLKVGGPAAKLFNIEVEDTVAVLGVLTDRGIEASEAGTAFRNILLNINKASPRARKALNKAGLTAKKLGKLLKDPVKLFDALSKASLSAADQQELFGKRAITAGSILLKNVSAISKLRDQITGTNSATEIAERQLASFGNQLKLLRSAISEAAISLFRSMEPALREFVTRLRSAFMVVAEFVSNNANLVSGVALAALGITGLVAVLAGMIAAAAVAATTWIGLNNVWAGAIKMLPGLTRAIALTNIKLLAMRLGAVGLAAAIGVALGTAINEFIKNVFPKFSKGLDDAIGKLISLNTEMDKAGGRAKEVSNQYLRLAENLIAKGLPAIVSNRAAFRALNSSINDVGLSAKNLPRPIKAAIASFQKGRTNAEQFRAEMERLAGQIVKVSKLTPEQRKAAPIIPVEEIREVPLLLQDIGEELEPILENMGLIESTISRTEVRWLAFANGVGEVIDLQGTLGGVIDGVLAGTQGVGESFKQVTKQITRSIAKALILKGILAGLKVIFGGGIIGRALGLEHGGIIGAQAGLLPPREDRLIAVQDGEAVLNRQATRALGREGVAALNAGQGGQGGMTLNVNIDSPFGVTEEQIEKFRQISDQARMNFPGGV